MESHGGPEYGASTSIACKGPLMPVYFQVAFRPSNSWRAPWPEKPAGLVAHCLVQGRVTVTTKTPCCLLLALALLFCDARRPDDGEAG